MGILGSIQSPMGTFFVHGNHDKTRYAGNPNFTAEQLEDAVRKRDPDPGRPEGGTSRRTSGGWAG